MLKGITTTLRRLASGIRLCRPRTLALLVKSSEDDRRCLRELQESVTRLRSELAEVTRRERQLRAIALADARLEDKSRALERILDDLSIAAHVRAAVAAAPLHEDPFPYAVVDRLLPDAVYRALIDGLPPAELFSDRAINKQQLVVPLQLGPAYSRRVWGYMADTIVPDMIVPAVLEKFRPQATAWLKSNFPAAGEEPIDSIPMTCSDGRILLRRPGYYIPPHRDPKWGFITCLLYLARRGDSEQWGTRLHRVLGDEDARGAHPHWIDAHKCEPAGHVAFRRNRALIFLNSVGAHSAEIPSDADPPDLERYAYQFRIGASTDAIKMLVDGLPADRRELWAGKGSEVY
jgi:hypothetical protein